jgi:hypothetical protein
MNQPLADKYGYRGIEYGVHEEGNGIWKWNYYPKVERGPKGSGTFKGTKEEAVAACKAAIDALLGPKNSNWDTTRA